MGQVERLRALAIVVFITALTTFFLFAVLAYLPGGSKGSLTGEFGVSAAEAQYSGGEGGGGEGGPGEQSGPVFDPLLMPGGDPLCEASVGRAVRECLTDRPTNDANDFALELATVGNGSYYGTAGAPGSAIYKLADGQGYVTFSPYSTSYPFSPTVYVNIPAYRDTIREIKFCDNGLTPCLASGNQ